ncbi:tetratricopeptide repeat protein [Desulfobotulus alkaliphilus]|uniref:Tetratricopeptide repeat protein n=1 Tax=Desulfobotulus alkaliphilus TaxID=622671 RepID=A0A562S685_9BACT|nr:tetratricopeptide repeat protein [Desulfobotulus alkaliphilus]TWI76881.1 tetratricopeptide repeat protein [Desulfobotulus alkaliphilus]
MKKAKEAKGVKPLLCPQKGSDPFCYLLILFFLIFGLQGLADASSEMPLPRSLQQVLADAGQDMGEGRSGEALAKLETFYEKNPEMEHPLLFFWLGNVRLQMEDSAAALIAYRKAVKLAPEDSRIWQNLAIAAHDTKAYGEAAHAMERAWETCREKNGALLYHSGLFHLMDKNATAAWQRLDRLMQLDASPRVEWVRAHAQAAMETGNEKKSIALLETVLDREPENRGMWELATHMYLRMKDYGKAIAALEIRLALEADPKASDFRLLGDLYANVNLPARAAAAYATAQEKGDGCPGLLVREVQMLQAAQMNEKALQRIEEAGRQGRDPALFELAMAIHMGENRYREAMDAGERYLHGHKGQGHNSRMLLTLGYCAYKAGEPEKARKFLERIPQRDKKARKEAGRLLAYLNTLQEEPPM